MAGGSSFDELKITKVDIICRENLPRGRSISHAVVTDKDGIDFVKGVGVF